jgi:hypothetical protein
MCVIRNSRFLSFVIHTPIPCIIQTDTQETNPHKIFMHLQVTPMSTVFHSLQQDTIYKYCCTDLLLTLFVKSKRSLSGATREPFWSASDCNTDRRAKFNTWVPVWLFITRRLRDVSRCNDTSSPSHKVPSTVPICSMYPPRICTFLTENSTLCSKENTRK